MNLAELALLDWPAVLTPAPLFNPLTSPQPLSRTELFAGPLGLVGFLPLAPVVLWLARFHAAAAIIVPALLWMLLTLRPATTAVLLGGVAVGAGWVILLHHWRSRPGRHALSKRGMTALVWLGLTALLLPLWWYPHPAWYPARMAPLHCIGLAYFYLRLLAWGVDWARAPGAPLRPLETAAWLLYPPIMRLGPVLLRDEFFRRLAGWRGTTRAQVAAGLKRLGLCALGVAGLGLVAAYLPRVREGSPDFFTAPESYSTGELLRALYLVPLQIYLLLWTYNELAAGLGRLIGLPVDNNFNWLPAATSVREFWRRWHVTVGGWLRTYIYIPLGGNQRSPWLTISAVFGFCALWHGASGSFLVWGLSQVVALVVQQWWDRLRGGRQTRNRFALAVFWLFTMQYQAATILIFADFEHAGFRLIGTLCRRLVGAGG